MTGIDTNVLLRFLVEDDPKQAEQASEFLEQSRIGGETVYVSSIVLCETVWVLRSAYGRLRPQILDFLDRLLGTDIFELEAEDAVRAAIQSCRTGKGDFADHLIGYLNLARGCRGTVTFDKDLRGAPGFTIL